MRLPDEPELPLQINIVPMIDVIFAILTADEKVSHGKVVAVMDRVREVPGAKLAIASLLKDDKG